MNLYSRDNKKCMISVADPEFPRGGETNHKDGVSNLFFAQLSPKTARKGISLDPEEISLAPPPPPDQPMDMLQIEYTTFRSLTKLRYINVNHQYQNRHRNMFVTPDNNVTSSIINTSHQHKKNHLRVTTYNISTYPLIYNST